MRKGDWIQTYTGKQFWPLDPRPEEVCLEDIAHSLALQCHFNGHCREFFSVAQHSILVADLLPQELKKWGLLHDAAEAYLGDLPRPIKRSSTLGFAYTTVEDKIMVVICEVFGLKLPMPQAVHEADNIILMTEKENFMGMSPAEWDETAKSLGIRLSSLDPRTAERAFLDFAAEYGIC